MSKEVIVTERHGKSRIYHDIETWSKDMNPPSDMYRISWCGIVAFLGPDLGLNGSVLPHTLSRIPDGYRLCKRCEKRGGEHGSPINRLNRA